MAASARCADRPGRAGHVSPAVSLGRTRLWCSRASSCRSYLPWGPAPWSIKRRHEVSGRPTSCTSGAEVATCSPLTTEQSPSGVQDRAHGMGSQALARNPLPEADAQHMRCPTSGSELGAGTVGRFCRGQRTYRWRGCNPSLSTLRKDPCSRQIRRARTCGPRALRVQGA